MHRPLCSPRERLPESIGYWIGGWMCFKAGLDAVAKTKSPILAPGGNRTPVARPAAYSILTDLS
jgi:hypothetical protein